MKTRNKMLQYFGNAHIRPSSSFQCITLLFVTCGIHFLMHIESIDAVTRTATSSDSIIVTEEKNSIDSFYLHSDLIQERRRRLDENETEPIKLDTLDKNVETTSANKKKQKKDVGEDEEKKKNSRNKESKAGKPKSNVKQIKPTGSALEEAVTEDKKQQPTDASLDKNKSRKNNTDYDLQQSNDKNQLTTKEVKVSVKSTENCSASTCESCVEKAQQFFPDSGDTGSRKSENGCYWIDKKCVPVKIDANYTKEYVSTEALCTGEKEDDIQDSMEQKQQKCSNETICEKCHEIKFDNETLTNDTAICWWNGIACELSTTKAHPDTVQFCPSSTNSTVPNDSPVEDFCKNATNCIDCLSKGAAADALYNELCWWDWNGQKCSSSVKHVFDDLREMCSANKTLKSSNNQHPLDECTTAITCSTCQSAKLTLQDALCWWNGTNCNTVTTAVGLVPSNMCTCEDAKSCSNCKESSENLHPPGTSTESGMSCFWNETIHSCHLTDTVSLGISLDGMCIETNGPYNVSVQAASADDQMSTATPTTAPVSSTGNPSTVLNENLEDISLSSPERDVAANEADIEKRPEDASYDNEQDSKKITGTEIGTGADPQPPGSKTTQDSVDSNPYLGIDDDVKEEIDSSEIAETLKNNSHDEEKSEQKSAPADELQKQNDEDEKSNEISPGGTSTKASQKEGDEEAKKLQTVTVDKASTDEDAKAIETGNKQSDTVPKKDDEMDKDNSSSLEEPNQPFETETNAIIFVALVSIAGFCLFRRCRSSAPINHQNGYRQQQKYEGISTQADDDEEWGWDESPSTSGKVTGMKLNSNSNSNLLHRSIPMDNTNGSHIRDKPRRTSSGQSQNSYKDADKTIGIRDGVNYKKSAKPIRQVQSKDPDDFFEEMGLAAKPKVSVNNKSLRPSKEAKRLQPIMPAKARIIPPPALPPPKKINKLGATTIKSDSFDDMGDDDWGDDDKDLDDLLND